MRGRREGRSQEGGKADLSGHTKMVLVFNGRCSVATNRTPLGNYQQRRNKLFYKADVWKIQTKDDVSYGTMQRRTYTYRIGLDGD